MIQTGDDVRAKAKEWWLKVLREHPDHPATREAVQCLRNLGVTENELAKFTRRREPGEEG